VRITPTAEELQGSGACAPGEDGPGPSALRLERLQGLASDCAERGEKLGAVSPATVQALVEMAREVARLRRGLELEHMLCRANLDRLEQLAREGEDIGELDREALLQLVGMTREAVRLRARLEQERKLTRLRAERCGPLAAPRGRA